MYKMKNLIKLRHHLLFIVLFCVLCSGCRKSISKLAIEEKNITQAETVAEANITYIPLSLTIYNPCCQENIYLSGSVHRVENSNVIHMDDRDIGGVGLTSGLHYTAQSASVRNYIFDPNEYLATLNWSIRMMGENGCDYNVQFVVHITRDEDGEIKASIHSGNFFCFFS